MEKQKFYKRMLLLAAITTIYLIIILSGSQFWGNVVSPIVALASGCLIWTTSRQRKYYLLDWTLLAILAFSWGITDSIWMIISNIYGLDPEAMPVFMYLYLIPNIILALATIVYFFKNMKKWYNVQLLLDIIITWGVILTFLWHIILKSYDIHSIRYDDIVNTFLYLLTDAFAVSIIFVMYSSSKAYKISNTMKMIISGIYVYALSDLYYTFLVFEDAYIPNSLIDFAFMCSIVMFGAASIYESYKPTLVYDPGNYEIPDNIGGSIEYVLLLLIPVIFYLMGHFPFKALVWLMIMVLIHQVLSSYVQRAIRNELLLRKERQMNEKLELLIAERTRDLVLANKNLDELSKADMLTGLYNRRYFLEELDKMFEDKDSKFSILYMDLDRFKIINDTHGHEMGDRILIAVSERLNAWKPREALLARLGGDEFAVIINGYIDCDKLSCYCEEINVLFDSPIVAGDYIFNVGVSIGVSRYPIDAQNRDQLMKYADIAMYHAKKEYGDRHCALYNQRQSDVIERRHEIEILLRNVEFDKEFELCFQPQFTVNDNRIVGVEALLRWNSSIKGYIPPADFIPVAEETGIILDIGKWVMNKAIEQVCWWNEKYRLNLVMGINISPRQIDSVDFLPDIKRIIQNRNFNPKWIDFEITENSAMNTNIVMEDILTELSGVGIQISIDDFGTGYSSMSYIKRFNIDRLKIAKELIDNISSDQNSLLIVRAIIMMAKGMDISTIAEGVETQEQLDILKILGCDEVQGYILSRPLSAEMLEDTFLAAAAGKQEIR